MFKFLFKEKKIKKNYETILYRYLKKRANSVLNYSEGRKEYFTT